MPKHGRIDLHHYGDARCLHGKHLDLATTSINAARESFIHAESDSDNDLSIVQKADADAKLAKELADRYKLRFDINV